MRQAEVFYKNELAGIIAENDEGYVFQYDANYLKNADSKPISLTLPLKDQPYKSKLLFPFFDGLIPEGWLLNIALTNWKLNQRDRFGLLLSLCKDTIGCISVISKVEEE
jgi:serine/threonine-protein kinase HipA